LRSARQDKKTVTKIEKGVEGIIPPNALLIIDITILKKVI
jgi:hypothetical protein